MIVFKLETLAQRGKAAVPAIRAFLGRNVDVEYGEQSNANNQPNGCRWVRPTKLNNNGGFAGGPGGRVAGADVFAAFKICKPTGWCRRRCVWDWSAR